MKCPEDHEMVSTCIEYIGKSKKPSKECWRCPICGTEFQITYARVGADELQDMLHTLHYKDRNAAS